MTPELDKRKKFIDSGQTDTLTEFVDWLGANDFAILRRCQNPIHETGRYCGVCRDLGYIDPLGERDYERLFARHFGLDLDKIQGELDFLLDRQRELNGQ